MIELRGVTRPSERRSSRSPSCIRWISVPAGQCPGDHRPVGQRQIDAARTDRRARRAVSGADPDRRHRHHRLDEDALARLRGEKIGFVFQFFHLVPSLTALENILVPLEIAGRRDAATRAQRLLDEVGCTIAAITTRRSSRAANSSASRSPARWPTIRRSSWPTSRPATLTRTTAGTSSIC